MDFKVGNSNQMEKKGFVDSLANVEANGIKVDIISTDRHPQIKKEMRVNQCTINHQFDPWHVAKSVSKKLSAASKKSGCSDLAQWIPSIVNHLWWCAESCEKDPEVLWEKWLSVIHHVTNRHEWPHPRRPRGSQSEAGEMARRKFSRTGGRTPGYQVSPDHFQTALRIPAPDWAE